MTLDSTSQQFNMPCLFRLNLVYVEKNTVANTESNTIKVPNVPYIHLKLHIQSANDRRRGKR